MEIRPYTQCEPNPSAEVEWPSELRGQKAVRSSSPSRNCHRYPGNGY